MEHLRLIMLVSTLSGIKLCVHYYVAVYANSQPPLFSLVEIVIIAGRSHIYIHLLYLSIPGTVL